MAEIITTALEDIGWRNLDWTREPEVLEGIRPQIADEAKTAHYYRLATFMSSRPPLIGPGAQSSPGNGVILTLWMIPSWRDGSK